MLMSLKTRFSAFATATSNCRNAVTEHSTNDKVMRAIKKPDSPIIEGQRMYYNHIRPHQGLNGKIPAQAAGLELDLGANKWESLIKKASCKPSVS
jgi:transposase InsO family protein